MDVPPRVVGGGSSRWGRELVKDHPTGGCWGLDVQPSVICGGPRVVGK